MEDITGKTVSTIEVYALSIKALVNHLMYTLAQRTGIQSNDIQLVITVAASWTEIVKQIIRKITEKVCIDII